MRIPANPFLSMPPATKAILVASLAGYVLGLFVPAWLNVLFGLVPALVLHKLWLWQALTYMFLHGSLFHIFFNMFALVMFGGLLEGVWGTRRFLKFYFACGLGAAALHVLLRPDSPVPVIGASGAIYGLLAAFALEFPEAVVYVYFFLPMKARTMAIVLAVVEFAASFNPYSHIANLAHLGGLATGVIYLKAGEWLARRKQEPECPACKYVDENQANAILEKVRSHGVSSLNEDERRFLDEFSRSLRGNR